MSVYTRVTPEEASGWLARHAVGELRELRGIAEGIENTNYRVETTEGRFVLTLFERLAAADLPFYLDLMAHLAAQAFPCPRPVADENGRTLGKLGTKPAALVSFLPGSPVEHPTPEQCAAVGTMLAELHRIGASFDQTHDNPRGPRWWKTTADEVIARLSADDAALLREELRFQSLYRFPDLPRGTVHVDLFRDNVLWEGGAISGVIDFYFAATDVLLYDVAIAANDWCVTDDSGLDPGRTRALLAGYHGRRPLSAIERGAWPVLLRAGALRFWLSRLKDFHAPRSGELTYTKDPTPFRDILRRRIEEQGALTRLWVQ
jgi:homoserine kinase type II